MIMPSICSRFLKNVFFVFSDRSGSSQKGQITQKVFKWKLWFANIAWMFSETPGSSRNRGCQTTSLRNLCFLENHKQETWVCFTVFLSGFPLKPPKQIQYNQQKTNPPPPNLSNQGRGSTFKPDAARDALSKLAKLLWITCRSTVITACNYCLTVVSQIAQAVGK